MLVIYSGLLFFSGGCVAVSEIALRQDGSAHVIVTNDYPRDHFYESSEVYDLSRINDSLSVAFNIRTIDSLGNYLYTGFDKNYFQFKYSQDTLVITTGNGPAFKERGYYFCFSFSIRITTDRKIKSFRSNRHAVKLKDNTIIISKSHRYFDRRGRNARVVIVFEK